VDQKSKTSQWLTFRNKTKVLTCIFVALIALGVMDCNRNRIFDVTLEQITQEYFTDPNTARKKYEGKQVRLTGIVAATSLKNTSYPYRNIVLGKLDSFYSIRAFFKDSDEPAAANADVGESITIEGTVMSPTENRYSISVGIKDCRLLENNGKT
jgi:hypothetical protein